MKSKPAPQRIRVDGHVYKLADDRSDFSEAYYYAEDCNDALRIIDGLFTDDMRAMKDLLDRIKTGSSKAVVSSGAAKKLEALSDRLNKLHESLLTKRAETKIGTIIKEITNALKNQEPRG